MYYKINLIILSFCFLACQRIEYFEPQAATFEETKVLAHAASGNSNEFQRNTIEAVKYGLKNLDGIEIDIAISKDNGLWLSHDDKVLALDKQFINVSDSELEEIKDSLGNPYYDKLEDVLKYMSDSVQDKTISLDIKYPVTINPNAVLADAAERIVALVEHYGLQNNVVVESGSALFLKKIRKDNPLIGTYIMSYGNYESGIADAYEYGFTGISFNYNRDDELVKESVELAHELGIKILVYTINNEDISIVHALGVDIIETDHMDYYFLLDQF